MGGMDLGSLGMSVTKISIWRDVGTNEDVIWVQNSRVNQTKYTLDALEEGSDGHPMYLESRLPMHEHRYTSTNNQKPTPEPSVTSRTPECSIQSVLATGPNGPSADVRNRTLRLEG